MTNAPPPVPEASPVAPGEPEPANHLQAGDSAAPESSYSGPNPGSRHQSGAAFRFLLVLGLASCAFVLIGITAVSGLHAIGRFAAILAIAFSMLAVSLQRAKSRRAQIILSLVGVTALLLLLGAFLAFLNVAFESLRGIGRG